MSQTRGKIRLNFGTKTMQPISSVTNLSSKTPVIPERVSRLPNSLVFFSCNVITVIMRPESAAKPDKLHDHQGTQRENFSKILEISFSAF